MGGISVFAQTDVGRVRKGNEDSLLVVGTTSENSASLNKVRQYNLNEGNKFPIKFFPRPTKIEQLPVK